MCSAATELLLLSMLVGARRAYVEVLIKVEVCWLQLLIFEGGFQRKRLCFEAEQFEAL